MHWHQQQTLHFFLWYGKFEVLQLYESCPFRNCLQGTESLETSVRTKHSKLLFGQSLAPDHFSGVIGIAAALLAITRSQSNS